jgi:speckle-type POZ protein
MANRSTALVIMSSRCIREHYVTTTLDYEVANYLELEGMPVGKFVSSPVFRVGGYDWEIRFYPTGYRSDCAGNASSFVRCLSQDDDGVSAKFRLSMLETKSQVELEVASSDDEPEQRTFVPERCWGHCKFVERSKLKSMSTLGDGCFTIRCLLTVTKESRPMELAGALERMLRDGRGADVTFRVGGQKFRAHRSVLAARSPVFGAQLFGSMAEKDMRRVKVVDMEPSIFETMLHYIYTDSLPPCDDEGGYNAPMMQHLLVAADRYGLESLKQMCEEELSQKIDVESVILTYALANQYHCNLLKAACTKFMASKKKVLAAVLETNEFKERFITSCRPVPLEGQALGTNSSCQEEEVRHRKKSKKMRTK